MSIFDLISDSIKDDHILLPVEPVENICAVTGELRPCIPRKKLFGSNFISYHIFNSPLSDFVGTNVFQTLKYRPERASSWVVTPKIFTKLKRIEVRPLVLYGVNSQRWSGYVTTSYKKHGAIGNVINNSKFGVWKFDDLLIDCSDSEKVLGWYNKLNYFLHKGLSRPVLESGQLNQWGAKQAGIEVCRNFLYWIKDKKTDPLYKFLCYLLPSQEEIKNENKSN
jgi:hypothetical protein